MRLEYVPLLQVQRELYRMPRDINRFHQYLRTMLNERGDDVDLPPLIVMNPMAREHVPALLDEYLEQDADRTARQAAAEAEMALPDVDGDYKIALVVLDDVKGGWTNRYGIEFSLRFGSRSTPTSKKSPRNSWLMAPLWASEPASLQTVREEIVMAAHRLAYLRQHGPATSLRDRLQQEGHCMARAGCVQPVLDADDLEYTRAVMGPLLDATDMGTAVECLYGDAAAKELGYTPRGLSHRAGLAMALYDALRSI